jgi:hypothetical protein
VVGLACCIHTLQGHGGRVSCKPLRKGLMRATKGVQTRISQVRNGPLDNVVFDSSLVERGGADRGRDSGREVDPTVEDGALAFPALSSSSAAAPAAPNLVWFPCRLD